MRLVPLLLLAACSSGFNSGLPNGKPIAELTGEEVCEMQERFAEYTNDAFDAETVCYMNARSSAEFQVEAGIAEDFTAACEESFEACIAENDIGTPFDVDEQCDPTEGLDLPPACDATVGQYEACFNAVIDGFLDYAKLKCGSPDEPIPELFGDEACDPIQPCITSS